MIDMESFKTIKCAPRRHNYYGTPDEVELLWKAVKTYERECGNVKYMLRRVRDEKRNIIGLAVHKWIEIPMKEPYAKRFPVPIRKCQREITCIERQILHTGESDKLKSKLEYWQRELDYSLENKKKK